jgi:ribosomal protein S18 acetylase RimI-like enzyme
VNSSTQPRGAGPRASLTSLSPAAAVALVKANWAAFYTHLGRAPGCELVVGRELSWLLSGVPDAFMNVVFRTDLPADHAGDIVDDALRHFRSQQVARLSWWVDGAGGPVGRLLESRGLTFNEGGTAMAADLRSLPAGVAPPAGVQIVPVPDHAALRSWIAVMRIGFGLPRSAEERLFELFAGLTLEPPLYTFLGLLDGRPVATSQLFVGAGVGGIYNVTCLPDARGRGIGTAVTRAAALEARRHALDVGILQASSLGYPIYRRLGFLDYGRLNVYELPAESRAPNA